MNITREVVTDLLPVYFSGEASGDTKMAVEDYSRQDPDFERIARSAAKPLETLRATAPIAAGSEKEKRDLESVRWGLFLGGCDLFYADPHSLRLALCLRRRASGRVRDDLGLGGSRLG